ncbi:MAG: LysM peptidoglycan-binding domain-containing protein [Gemmatimonadales bacterium]
MAQHRSTILQVVVTFSLVALMPASVLAQQPESHTVRQGDTLWDIAASYLGDPFLWPQIYRLNTDVVEDPHWIYPGEVLRLTGGADVAAVPDVPQQVPPDQMDQPDQIGQPDQVVVVVEDPGAPGQVAQVTDADVEPATWRPLTRRQVTSDQSVVLNPLMLDKPTPISFSEFHSAGFLTERRRYPFGLMRGSVTPSEIRAGLPQVSLADRVGVTPPEGGSYLVGDSLLLVRFGREIEGYGNVIVPTGVLRVVEVSEHQAVGEIIRVFQAILAGQMILPLPVFNSPGQVESVPVADGITATVITNRDRADLTQPLHVLFLDKGRDEGVKLGDIFELRRTRERRDPLAATTDELMGTVQIVNVNDHTSSAQVLNIVFTDIRPGTEARQVARLPT